MPLVSEKPIERTWRWVGAMDETGVIMVQEQHRKAQKSLMMFTTGVLDEYREDAAGVLLYVFNVVLAAFRNAAPRPRPVSNRQLDLMLQKKPLAPVEPDQILESSSEPHVLRYAYEAFTEPADDVTLSEHEVASFLAIIDVVAECLHNACRR